MADARGETPQRVGLAAKQRGLLDEPKDEQLLIPGHPVARHTGGEQPGEANLGDAHPRQGGAAGLGDEHLESRPKSQTPPTRRTIDVGRQTAAGPSQQSMGTSMNDRSHALVRSA